jgi:phage-related tail protein
MELLVSELYLLVAAICGGVTVIIYSRGRFGNTEINTKLKNRYNEYIGQLETENKKLKGQVNRAKQPVRITEEAAEDPLSAISEVVDGLIPHLPPQIRPLLKSKKAVDFITNYVQQNPEAVKDIISKFTKQQTNGKPNPDNPTGMEQTL